MTSTAPRDCVVMFTHKWDERIERHYKRLQREAGLPVFLALHSEDTGPVGVAADIVVSFAAAAREWPARYEAYRRVDRATPFGYVDLLWLTAFRSPQLADYDRFWLVEYDVDFSGDWSRFFDETATYDADLLVTHMRRRADQSDWDFLPEVIDPLDRHEEHVIGLFSISRLSRRLVDLCHATYARPGWAGHFELVIPTIALRNGLTVEDLGGSGRFTPPARRNRHYEGSFVGLHRGFFTHGFRPARLWHYYAESKLGFWQPNRIYHPIKLDGTPRQRRRARIMVFRDRIRAFLVRLVGREPIPKALQKK